MRRWTFTSRLRDGLPDAAILAVVHGETVPRDPDGAPFYSTVLEIRDGVGKARPVAGPTFAALRHAAE